MNAMNRLFSSYSEHQNAPFGFGEWSIDILCTFKVEQNDEIVFRSVQWQKE